MTEPLTLEQVQALVTRQPYHQWLGLKVTAVHDDGIERIAMHDQQTAPVSSDVNRVIHHLDAPELQLCEISQPLVVIPRDIDDPRSLADLAQQLLDYIVVRLRPVPGFLQPPAVDDVADQINRLRFGESEEIEEEFNLAATGPEMHVGDPDRAIAEPSRSVRHFAHAAISVILAHEAFYFWYVTV